MGCASSLNRNKIQRSTVVELFDEAEVDKDISEIEVAEFRANGKLLKVYFRTITPSPTRII